MFIFKVELSMKIKLLFLFLIVLSYSSLTYSQVKVGDNPDTIDRNSILELESPDKVLVITRMTTLRMTSITPLEGALVYNTDEKCVFVYRNTSWKNLCDISVGINISDGSTEPAKKSKGDIWINNNITKGWNGTRWVTISKSSEAENGLTYDNTTNKIKLGGTLNQPTSIDTNGNDFAIKGIKKGDVDKDNVLTIDKTTGNIRQVNMTNMFRKDEFVITIGTGKVDINMIDLTTEGKKLFSNKVDVYRNGVKIGVTIDKQNNKITINDQEAYCCEEDRIRIVQFY